MKRLVVSSNDFGSAQQNAALMDYLIQKDPNLEFLVFSNPTTRKVYKNLKSSRVIVGNPARMKSELDDFEPTSGLVGLSTAANNLDDRLLLLLKRHKISSYCIQDYWGYLGNFEKLKTFPESIFVLDNLARTLTQHRIPATVDCWVSGSPKHFSYRNVASTNLSSKKGFKVMVVLQPSYLAGVVDNIQCFAEALRHLDKPISLSLKLHPADLRKVGQWRRIFGKQPHRVNFIDPNRPLLSAVHRSDLLVTCYSTVGLDHSFLQAYSSRPIGHVIYLNIGRPIRRLLKSLTGMDRVPAVDLGLGHLVTRKKEIVAAIQSAIYDKSQLTQYFMNSKMHLKSTTNPSKIIGDVILNSKRMT